MNFETFKTLLIKSNRKIFLVSLLLLGIGIPMAIGSYMADNNKAGLIISGIFIVLGLLVLIRSLSDSGKIKNDEHPLLYALKNQQSDYLIWIYAKEIISNVQGVDVGKSSNIMLYSKDNKLIEMALGRKEDPNAVINYLSNAFPKALVGFSEENKKTVEGMLKK